MYKKTLVSLAAVMTLSGAAALVGPVNGTSIVSSVFAAEETEFDAIAENNGSSLLIEGDIAFEYPGYNGLTLSGSIRLPNDYEEGERYPVAILSHGVLGDRNQQGMFTALSAALEKKGFVVVRFDFDGYGESEGSLVYNSIKSEKEDLDAIIDYVQTLDYVDTDRINLIGYSMGGAASSLVAGERSDDIHSVALWSAAAVLFDDVANGRILGTKVDLNNIPDEISIFGGAYTFGKAWFEDALGVDVYGISGQYEGPALVVHGENDVVVPLSYSEKYNEVYGKESKLVVVKDGEHVYAGEPLEHAIKRTVNFLYNENNRQN